MKNVQRGKSATRNEYSTKNVILKNSAKWKKCNKEKCNTKWVQHKKVQHYVNATWSNTRKGATWEGCNTQKSATWTWYDTKKVQPEKSAIWKSATRIKPNTKWVHHKKSDTWSECNTKQHEKRCNMKRVQEWNMQIKKVHKKSALELKWITGRPSDRYTLVMFKAIKFSNATIQWFRSYLSGQIFLVNIKSKLSNFENISCGIS